MRIGGDDVGGDRAAVAVALSEPADQRAEAGVIAGGGIHQRIVALVGPADDRPVHSRVVTAVRMMDGADDGQLVGPPGEPGNQLRHLDSRHVGVDRLKRSADGVGGGRLRVPQIEVTGPAAIEDQDD